eukprot:6917019-Prorocentrum_lima.AAC.1
MEMLNPLVSFIDSDPPSDRVVHDEATFVDTDPPIEAVALLADSTNGDCSGPPEHPAFAKSTTGD